MIHGVGLEEENPSVCFPADGQSNGDRVLEPGMLAGHRDLLRARWAPTTA